MEKPKCKHKGIKITFITLASLFLLAVLGFFLYASTYYRADETALSILQSGEGIAVQGNLTILTPAGPSDTALLFYPGAKVEHTAYLPLLQKLQQSGITCVLVQMPFNMAIFGSNAANHVFEQLPGIQHWYIGGHSMGGAMASGYASGHPGRVEGLVLLGAYIYGDYPPKNSLTVYGTFNANLEENIDYTENIVILEGGNHAQFGNYGPQKGDPPATISAEEQQEITVEAILAFIDAAR